MNDNDKPLEYEKLILALRTVQAMGDKIFHPSTPHKPKVSIDTPTVHDNIADFYVEFTWEIPHRGEWRKDDKRLFVRIKNIEQFMAKLEKASEGADLKYGIEWHDVEFGIRGEGKLSMYAAFWVGAAPSYVWAKQVPA